MACIGKEKKPSYRLGEDSDSDDPLPEEEDENPFELAIVKPSEDVGNHVAEFDELANYIEQMDALVSG